MADGGKMKGVEGSGEGTGQGEDMDEEAREELELALSLGRRGWHLPPAPAPPPAPALRWSMVFPAWDSDAAGSSRAAESVWDSPPVPPLRFRDMWRGGGANADAGGAGKSEEHNNVEEEEGSEDGERDLQNKRPKVVAFGE